jgi:DNA-binding NarL/FixJ family response regulator
MTYTKRKILIADDHVIIRRGLKALIDNFFGKSEWIETDTTFTLEDIIKESQITHMVLDMQLLDANVIDILPQIRLTFPNLPIMIYTMSSEDIFASRIYHMGIQAFLSKNSDESEVIKAFTTFFAGKRYFNIKVYDSIESTSQSNNNLLNLLSERELSVMGYLIKGHSVKEICYTMGLKATTIATYKARIFDKLGVTNIIDLNNIAQLYNYEKS